MKRLNPLKEPIHNPSSYPGLNPRSKPFEETKQSHSYQNTLLNTPSRSTTENPILVASLQQPLLSRIVPGLRQYKLQGFRPIEVSRLLPRCSHSL